MPRKLCDDGPGHGRLASEGLSPRGLESGRCSRPGMRSELRPFVAVQSRFSPRDESWPY
jgi:hypothetical protein